MHEKTNYQTLKTENNENSTKTTDITNAYGCPGVLQDHIQSKEDQMQGKERT